MGEVVAAALGRDLDDVRGLRPRRRHRRARAVEHRLRRRCAAATSSATTRCSSPAPASASRSRIASASRATYAAGQPARGALPGRQSSRACSAWTTVLGLATGRRDGNRPMTRPGFSTSGRRATASRAASPRCCSLMSISAWVVILWKGWLLRRVTRDMQRAVPAFWAAPSLDDGRAQLAAFDRESVLRPLLDAALAAPPRRHARGARPRRLAADAAPARRAAPRARPAAVRPGAAGLDRQHRALHRPVRHRLGHLPRAAQHLGGRRDHDRAASRARSARRW